MANKVLLKKSSVAAKAPTADDLDYGELAINYQDGKLYFKKANNTIDSFSSLSATSTVTSVDGNVGDITAQQLLDAVKKVDGSGSGLDADLLDGLSSASYAKSGANTDITSLTGLTGGISTADYIDFDSTATVTPQAGRIWWEGADDQKTLSVGMADGVVQQVGQETYFRIKATAPITNGQVVMFTGTVGSSGALTGAPATGLTPETGVYVMGIATQDIALNGWGYVTNFGLVRGIDTTGGAEAWTNGTILYYNPTVPGGLTKTVPTAPNPKVMMAAVVLAAANGSIFVRVNHGSVLGGTDGNVQFGTLANGNLISYNGTASRWENVAQNTITSGDSDKLDGQHGSYYLDWTNTTNKPDPVITVNGDASGSVTLTDLASGTLSLTLANSGVTAGTYNNSATEVRPFTVDVKGRVTGIGTAVTITPAWSSITGKPTTLTGYGITDAQPLDGDLTAIAGLTGTTGFLKKTAANTWSLDTNTYLTANQSITISGDASGTGTTSISLTLANSGVTAGTYTKVTVDSKGRVTSGASLASGDLPTYTGTLTSSQITTGLGYTPENSANKGVANGYASLDSAGKVPSTQLPSYVDDVLEYANLAAFPATGETAKIYVALDTNKTYRWSGSAYVEISPSPGTTDSLTEGSTNLYFTTARARSSISATQNVTYNSSTGVITGPDLSGYLTSSTASSTYQPLDADLTSIAGLTGTSGFLKKTSANTWSLDTNTYLTGNQSITLSGDATGTGSTAITVTLANSGVTAGTYTKVTVDAKGRVTAGASLASADLPTYTGTLTSSQITTGLGYTPYNSTNPSGYITSSASITGNAATATKLQTARSINGVSFDGSANIVAPSDWLHSGRDFPNGTLVETTINYSQTQGDPWILEIRGNAYGALIPFEIQYQGYIYSDTIINHGGYSVGTSLSGLVAFNYNGKLCFWYPSQGYWHGYNVRVYTAHSGYPTNRISAISAVTKPTGITKEVALSANIRQVLHSGNYTSYSPSLTGSGASGTWGINVTGSAGSINGYNNPTTSPTANTIAYRNAEGDIAAREIVLSSNISTATPTVLVSMFPSTNQLVRTTPAAVAAAIQGAASGSWGINITGNAATVTVNYNNDSNSTYQMLWGSGSSVYGTAGIYCNPSTDTLYASNFDSTSDIRYKTDIELIKDPITKVQQLNGYTFTLTETGTRSTGVIAQELELVLPEAVHGTTDKKTVSYGNLVGLLIEAIKEQQAQIDELLALVVTK